MLNTEQRKRLLEIARQSIRAAVAGESAPDLSGDDPELARRQGAFVTLKRCGELRGCIGHIEGIAPLNETIVQMARAAALEDPRFPPVTADEIAGLEIEISVMSPLYPVDDVAEIQIGRDGLIIGSGGARGLLLPQVAVEWGWGVEEFLRHTCIKAGLSADAWEGDCTIERFEAEVFGERDLAV